MDDKPRLYRPLQGWCPVCRQHVVLDERGRALQHHFIGTSGPLCLGSGAQLKPATPPVVEDHLQMHRTDQGRLRRSRQLTSRKRRFLHWLLPHTF